MTHGASFQAGEVVEIKSGGAPMTITAIRGKTVSVAWFVKGSLRRTTFPAAALKVSISPASWAQRVLESENVTPEQAMKAYTLLISGDES